MAAAGHPVSDLYPLGGAVSLESTIPSSTQAIIPPRLAAEPGYTYLEQSKEADSEVCSEHSVALSTRETNSNSSLGICGKRDDQRHNSSEHCVAASASNRHQSMRTHSPHHQINVNAISNNPQAGRTVQSIMPASLPVHRCPSGPLPLGNQGGLPQPSDSETCTLAYHREDRGVQDAESHSMLACKQPMQLQQCNIITTICRGASTGERGAQQPQGRCVCVSSPKAAAKLDGVEKKAHLPPECDKELCCGSYIHPANFEDTFAAYCHPQPIPAPSQLLPRHIEPSCDIQRAVAPPSANHLTLPRLISSVSETGLDAKHLLRCCNLSCSWINTLPPGVGTQSQKHFGLEECCSSPAGHVRIMTKDTGTMTAPKELRDVGVQTGQTSTPHVFPQICLAEESRSEASCSQTADTESDGGKKPGGAPKSPVKEVKWDAEGMTWEVYGASVDPEELGLAIQKHLELQIKETASRAAKLSRQNTNTSRQSRDNGSQRKRSRMIGSIRTPSCCARTSTAVD